MKVKKSKWLVVLRVVAMLFALVPATASAGHEGPGVYAFIPNSGEATVSKVVMNPDAPPHEVARYSTIEDRTAPAPANNRTARLAVEEIGGNAWALNTMSLQNFDGYETAQGSVARISGSPVDGEITELPNNNTSIAGGLAGLVEDDVRVSIFDVGGPGDAPRTIDIVEDEGEVYIWIGFYRGNYFQKYWYNNGNLEAVDGALIEVGNYTPYYTALDDDGWMWVSSRDSGWPDAGVPGVFRFDTNDLGEGIEVLEYDIPGTTQASDNPYAIQIASDGKVWISDAGNFGNTNRNRHFAVYDADGDVEYVSVGTGHTGMRGFIEYEGEIWATSDNGKLAHGTHDENEPANYGWTFDEVRDDLGSFPVGIGADTFGFLWIVQHNQNQLLRFDPDDPEAAFLPVDVGLGPYAYAFTVVTEVPTYEICGFKYLEGSEPLLGLAGWTIILEMWDEDADDGGAWVQIHSTVTSDGTDDLELGQYCFDNLLAGTYRVTETVEPGWTQVYPYDEGADEGYEYAYVVMLPDGATYADPDNPGYYNFINEEDMLEPVCETAWAYGGEGDYQEEGDHPADAVVENKDVEDNPSSAWGWTNEVGDAVHYVFGLYTGAGQNDLDKGELVGTVTVHIDGEDSWVEYELFEEDCWLSEVHLWVGETELPMPPRGRDQIPTPTAAPGQFNYIAYPGEGESVYQFDFDVSGMSEIWIAAHAVVCCYEVME